jgi:WD40 repeat protein
VKTFNHQEVVCAVTLSSKTQHVFTGGKGIVKIWDASEELGNTEHSENEDNLSNSRSSSRADNNNPAGLQLPNSSNISRPGSRCSVKNANQELYQIEGLRSGNYIRSCKIYESGSKMIIGGEADVLTVWDLPTSSSGTPQKIAELTSEAPACYALCVPEDGPSSTCYACCSDGFVSVWDLRSHSIVKKFRAHNDGASCVDFKSGQLWTGGLDNSVKSWDIRNIGDSTVQNHLNMYDLPAQVFSLSCNPNENWVACGLEDSTVEVLNTGPVLESTDYTNKYKLHYHDSCVLALKYSNSGRFMVSTGKDNTMSTWHSPDGQLLIGQKEQASVLCCDVSSDDRYVLTGSGDRKASLYKFH